MNNATDARRPSPTTVLLIEDNPGDVDLIQEMLADSNDPRFHLEWADRLSAGLARISKGSIDAILLDFSLPDSDGLDSLKRVGIEAPGVAVVILTGLAEEFNLGIKVLQAGAQDYLIKGQIDSRLLIRALRYAIERKQIEKELSAYKDQLEHLVAERTMALRVANDSLRQEFTERMRVEQKLRQITDNMLDIVCQIDPDGIIEFASPSCREVLGVDPDSLLGQSIYSRVHPDDILTVKEAIQTVGRVEYRYLYADGHYIWLETLSNLLLEKDGTIKGIILATRDVTERKRAEKEQQDLSQLKTDFLATAAHELRTPLVSIQGFSELLISRALDEARQKRYLSMINEQSKYLARIVNALLDVSRLESKHGLDFSREPIQLAELVDKVSPPLFESSPKHRLEIDGLRACPPVIGDLFRLTQLFENLLSNAVKYSPTGGVIVVRARAMGNCVEIAIQDEGMGMTAEQQTHLFEKFYRADASNTAMGGTGLGLAISRSIIELHGGRIWLESERGVGTTVYFTLPQASPANSGSQSHNSQSHKGKTIC